MTDRLVYPDSVRMPHRVADPTFQIHVLRAEIVELRRLLQQTARQRDEAAARFQTIFPFLLAALLDRPEGAPKGIEIPLTWHKAAIGNGQGLRVEKRTEDGVEWLKVTLDEQGAEAVAALTLECQWPGRCECGRCGRRT